MTLEEIFLSSLNARFETIDNPFCKFFPAFNRTPCLWRCQIEEILLKPSYIREQTVDTIVKKMFEMLRKGSQVRKIEGSEIRKIYLWFETTKKAMVFRIEANI